MWIVFESRDGSTTLLSEKYGITYHSKYGAVQEGRHVFIKEGLYTKCIVQKELKILEMGFGTGLNALLTFIEAEKLGLKIQYTAVDKYPVDGPTLNQLNYCKILGLNENQGIFSQIHQAAWGEKCALENGNSLLKIKKSFQEVELDQQFDIIYFDAFAPAIQPELWEKPLMQKMYNALAPKGILVTYCAKGDFKRTLRSIGFQVHTLKGPPGKREMVRGVKNGGQAETGNT